MLHVWSASGEELAAFRPEEMQELGVTNAATLKQRLRTLLRLPLALQRLVHNGAVLDDSATLDSLFDVQLVLLPVHDELSLAEWMDVDEAFHESAKQGHVETVRMLLAAGVEASARVSVHRAENKRGRADDGYKTYALYEASSSGSAEVVRLLLEARAEVDRGLYADEGESSDDSDLYISRESPLSVASQKGHVEVVRLLLEARANVTKHAPLRKAMDNHREEVVRLLEAQATPSVEKVCCCTMMV